MMKYYLKDDNILSNTIEVMRFPLVIGVIFIHMNPKVVNLIDANINLLSHDGLFNLLRITFSHVLAGIAVPCFFFISGLLFFINMPKWNWIQYKSKLKSRVTSILIPYIAWNLTPWILMLIGYCIKGYFIDHSFDELNEYIHNYNFNILYNCHHWGETGMNWLGKNLLMTGPYDLPLWFLRDLIFMIILTPIIYFFVKKLNLWYIAILFIAYVSRIWILIPGLHITACFFFSLGAFCSIKNINILSIIKRYRYVIIPFSIIFLFINILYDGANTRTGQNIFPFFIITTIPIVFYITSLIVKKYNIKGNKLLVSSCFFIYAFHAVPVPGSPLSVCRKISDYMLPEFPIIKYLLVPFLTAFVCIFVMQISKRILPNITKWYTGNR